ncbi:hypothetical protein ACFQ51_14820 [Streptomyces kaempferi]
MAQSGSEVHYTSPDSAQEIVANATPAKGDLLAQWQQAEGDTSKGLDYRRIRLEPTTFRGESAVAWEYTVMARGSSGTSGCWASVPVARRTRSAPGTTRTSRPPRCVSTTR